MTAIVNNSKPQILFITEHPPSSFDGVGRRVQQTLSGLRLAGDVHTLLLLIKSWQAPEDDINTTLISTEFPSKFNSLIRWLIGCRPYRSHIKTAHHREVKKVLSKQWDLVWFFRARTFLMYGHLVSDPVVVDLDDLVIESMLNTAIGTKTFSLHNIIAKVDINRWRTIHAQMGQNVQSLVVCKDEDRQHLKNDNIAIDVIFNGYPDVHPVWQSDKRQHYMIFVGGYNYSPNAQAAVFLAQQVLPLIRKKLPNFRLLLIGRSVHNIEDLAVFPGVEILGEVADLVPYYAQCCCAAIPLFYGSGSSLKTVEALAYGVLLVTNKFGMRGFHFKHNKQAVIAEDAVTFAEAIVRIASDQQFATHLAQAGRQHFEDHLQSSIAMQSVQNLVLRNLSLQSNEAMTLEEIK